MKYNIIYADPPFRYSNKMVSNNGYKSSPENHYDTMSFDDILSLDVKSISEKDCALFIWSSSSYLEGVMKVIKSWGFKYKTVAFVWVKKNKNDNICKLMGHWTLSSCEFVLIATKGAMKKHLQKKNTGQIVFAKRTRHSEKPDEIKSMIDEMFPDVKKIELFARKKTSGWDAFGNEVESDIKL